MKFIFHAAYNDCIMTFRKRDRKLGILNQNLVKGSNLFFSRKSRIGNRMNASAIRYLR